VKPRRQAVLGRPRAPEVDRAILDATAELLGESGLDGTSIEAVALRAGVSRPTIYRRYANRGALVEAATRDAFDRYTAPPLPTRDAMADVHALLESTLHMLQQTPIGPMFRAIIPHLPRHPKIGALANEMGLNRRRVFHAALLRAVAAGELPAERDLDALIDGVLGAIYFRFFITGRQLDSSYTRQLLQKLI